MDSAHLVAAWNSLCHVAGVGDNVEGTDRVRHAMALARVKTARALLGLFCAFAAAGWSAQHVAGQTSGPAGAKAAPEPVRRDYYGDPLPPGALVRLGTVQLRHHSVDQAFSADGKTLITAGSDATVRFWDLATGRQRKQTQMPLPKLPDTVPANSVAALSPDGKLLAGFTGETLYLYDTERAVELRRLRAEGIGHQMAAFSADGKLLATVVGIANNYVLRLWELPAARERFTRKREDHVSTILFSPDGKVLASWEEGQILRLWDTTTGRELRHGPVAGSCLAFSSDGKLLATADHLKGTVTLWKTADLKELATLKPSPAVTGHFILTPCLCFSPDGALLAQGGQEALVLWDVAARKELRRLADREAKRLAFTPDGKTLASAGEFEIRLWEPATGRRLHARPGHDKQIHSVAVSPDGKTVATASWVDPVVRLWNAATGQPLPLPRTLKHDSWTRSCAFTAEGRLLLSGGTGGLRLLETATGKEVRRFAIPDLHGSRAGHEVLVSHLSTDGTRLAAVSLTYDRQRVGDRVQITVWDAGTGAVLARRSFRGGLDSGFTPDGMSVTVDGQEHLTIEDTLTGRARVLIPGDLGHPVAFSPDGKLLAVGLHQTESEGFFGGIGKSYRPLGVRVAEAASAEELFHIDGWTDFVAFAPDGRVLATADVEALRLWDVVTGAPLFHRPWQRDAVRRPLKTPITSLAFLPNGRAVLTGLGDGTALVWDLEPQTWPKLHRAVNALGRKELDALWSDLAGEARKARRAISVLSAAPAQAVPFLADHLRPVAALDAKRVQALLADLDSNQFAVRNAAARELTQMGEQVEPALRRLLAAKPPLEVRQRVETILAALVRIPPAATLRTLRAIEVLEHIGTPEARQVLHTLAGGAAAARETREAQTALDHLARPSAGTP